MPRSLIYWSDSTVYTGVCSMMKHRGLIGFIWITIWIVCIWKLCTGCTTLPKDDEDSMVRWYLDKPGKEKCE